MELRENLKRLAEADKRFDYHESDQGITFTHHNLDDYPIFSWATNMSTDACIEVATTLRSFVWTEPSKVKGWSAWWQMEGYLSHCVGFFKTQKECYQAALNHVIGLILSENYRRSHESALDPRNKGS